MAGRSAAASTARSVFFFKKLGGEGRARAASRRSGDGEPAVHPDAARPHRVPRLAGRGCARACAADAAEASWRRPEAVDVILRNSGAVVRTGGSRPSTARAPTTSSCRRTRRSRARKRGRRRRCTSWPTGRVHQSRLDRDLSGKFGTRALRRGGAARRDLVRVHGRGAWPAGRHPEPRQLPRSRGCASCARTSARSSARPRQPSASPTSASPSTRTTGATWTMRETQRRARRRSELKQAA